MSLKLQGGQDVERRRLRMFVALTRFGRWVDLNLQPVPVLRESETQVAGGPVAGVEPGQHHESHAEFDGFRPLTRGLIGGNAEGRNAGVVSRRTQAPDERVENGNRNLGLPSAEWFNRRFPPMRAIRKSLVGDF